jgi:hypothetical protein
MTGRVSDEFVLFFDPSQWTAARRLQVFVGPPLNHPEVRRGAEASMSHLEKYQVLVGLANRLVTTLREDQEELDRDGYSPAQRSKEFAALIEVLACELYSAIDGVRRALYGTYKGVSGIRKDSNDKMFDNASNRKYGPEFPEALRAALDGANLSWFKRLRALRTEVTHGSTGSCSLNREKGTISYFHRRLGSDRTTLIDADIVGRLNEYHRDVKALTEIVFSHLYTLIEPREDRASCGIYRGRLYERTVRVGEELTFASGRCYSKTWFLCNPKYSCPLSERCPAFLRACSDPE